MNPKNQKQIVAILGLIVGRDGRVLITQRHQPQSVEAHLKWQIPGGELEFGEDSIQTLVREMKEEVGVEVEVIHLIPFIGSSLWKTEGKETQVILVCYLVRIREGALQLDGVESKTYQWIKPEEIRTFDCLPLVDRFILLAKDYIDQYEK